MDRAPVGTRSWMLAAPPASPQPHEIHFVLTVGRWIRCIQRMKFIGCECQCERDGVLLYMLRQARFGNCDDITIADGPGQRDSSCRAIMWSTDTCKRGIAQQASACAAER